MKLAPAAFVILAFVALPGCSGLGTLTTATADTVSQVAPEAFNAAKKALTAAHDLHASTARFLTIAATSNLCIRTCAATAKGYLDRSEDALIAADSLVALGDAPGINAKISAASLLLGNVTALVGRK